MSDWSSDVCSSDLDMVGEAVKAAGAAARDPDAARPGILDIDFPAESKFDRLPAARAVQGPTAFLSVQEGCDKFCSFCVVPYTRGAEYSRPAAQILAEARRLAGQEVVEKIGRAHV